MLEVGTRIRMRSGEKGVVTYADTVRCLSCAGKGHRTDIITAESRLNGNRTSCQTCCETGMMLLSAVTTDPLKVARGPVCVVRLDEEKRPRVFYEEAMRPLTAPELLAELA